MLSLKIYEINVTFGVKAHNFDILFIIYMHVLPSSGLRVGSGMRREPKIQKGENTKYDKKVTSTLRNHQINEAACLIVHLSK